MDFLSCFEHAHSGRCRNSRRSVMNECLYLRATFVLLILFELSNNSKFFIEPTNNSKSFSNEPRIQNLIRTNKPRIQNLI